MFFPGWKEQNKTASVGSHHKVQTSAVRKAEFIFFLLEIMFGILAQIKQQRLSGWRTCISLRPKENLCCGFGMRGKKFSSVLSCLWHRKQQQNKNGKKRMGLTILLPVQAAHQNVLERTCRETGNAFSHEQPNGNVF